MTTVDTELVLVWMEGWSRADQFLAAITVLLTGLFIFNAELKNWQSTVFFIVVLSYVVIAWIYAVFFV